MCGHKILVHTIQYREGCQSGRIFDPIVCCCLNLCSYWFYFWNLWTPHWQAPAACHFAWWVPFLYHWPMVTQYCRSSFLVLMILYWQSRARFVPLNQQKTLSVACWWMDYCALVFVFFSQDFAVALPKPAPAKESNHRSSSSHYWAATTAEGESLFYYLHFCCLWVDFFAAKWIPLGMESRHYSW